MFGSVAQSLKVSLVMASGLAKDRSITEGLSPGWRARWVISPRLFRRVRFLDESQSAIVEASWSGLLYLSFRAQEGWCRLKSPVRRVAC